MLTEDILYSEGSTENPCVPGSIPGGTTYKKPQLQVVGVFLCIYFLTEWSRFENGVEFWVSNY
jgi:hypothetical protein